eukprot:2048389-Rhodomonas_salina.2
MPAVTCLSASSFLCNGSDFFLSFSGAVVGLVLPASGGAYGTGTGALSTCSVAGTSNPASYGAAPCPPPACCHLPPAF